MSEEATPPEPSDVKPKPDREGILSYRVSLVVVVPLLVIITGLLIAGNSYVTTRGNIADLADNVFQQGAGQAAEEARAHVFQAAPATELLSGIFVDPQETDDLHALSENLLAVLRANAGFEWVSYSDESGNFTGARRRPDGKLIINHSYLKEGRTITDENLVGDDNYLQPILHREDTGYDPRTRPFYALAKGAKKHVWTDPYVFYDEGVPGITCASPVLARDGRLRGVVTVDFDLNVLSTFAANLHLSPNARVFVYTNKGEILAHPTARVVTKSGGRGEGHIVTKDDIDDPTVRAYFAAGNSDRFSIGKEPWFKATRALPHDDNLQWSVGAVAPESDFMADVDRTTRFSLAVSLAAVLASVIFAAWLAGRVAAPLEHLSSQMAKVGQFELGGDDPPPSLFREIAMMNRALSAMKGGLQSFAYYVPRDLVRAVLASGQRAVLGGKTREMTVFFSDLQGFTTLSERLRPKELVEMLGGYFDAMTHIIGEHGGTVDKFIGDAIMAFWNAPLPTDEHPARATEAALECMRKLDRMKIANPELGDLAARIGIATGEVVVGNIGSHERMNYTVMGDTANVASRLEGLNKMYGTRILVGETTYAAARERVVMRAIDIVAVKGKQKGVRVYEPLALASDEDAAIANDIATTSAAALEAYLARKFEEAAALWEQVIAKRPNDTAATLMRDRAKAHATAPPPEDWNGVMIAKEK